MKTRTTIQERAIISYYASRDFCAARPDHSDEEAMALVRRGLLRQDLGSFDSTAAGEAAVESPVDTDIDGFVVAPSAKPGRYMVRKIANGMSLPFGPASGSTSLWESPAKARNYMRRVFGVAEVRS